MMQRIDVVMDKAGLVRRELGAAVHARPIELDETARCWLVPSLRRHRLASR
jgi:hypothetical protein